MKRIFAAVLSAMLVLSLAACTDSTESSSQTSSGSSSVAEQSSEPDISGLTVKEEDMSNLDANSEAEPEHSESSQPEQNSSSQASSQKPEQNSSQASSQKPEQNSSQAASQPPVEQKPAETSKPEKEEDVFNLDTKVDSKPVKPAEQPSQPSTPAVPETDDTGWTQAKVDAVVEAYRSAALERGWTEDTSLNIALTTGGAWGNPFNTNWTDYNVLTDPANIEEYLYGYEFDRNAKPEDMYFHVVVEKHSDYWEIYFIFA